ncbi:MAG: RluA family pseudouridine synthase [Ruminococcaceae bacterium]|nr:RluA family pseudouridine synthase [Oscillospiraceae bacterium]
MIFEITKAEDGAVLRSFLKETLRLSSHTVTLLKRKEKGILLNGAHVTVRAILRTGDTLSLAIEDEESNEDVVPCALPLTLLYEDESVDVCMKPSDMPTHPSHGHFADTLANALAYRYRDTPFVFRAITRLDRETSGAVLVARNAVSAHRLSLAMKAGQIEKSYFALVHGATPDKGRITLPIRRQEGSVILREVHPDGAPAETLYQTLATNGNYSLVAVFPKTGRTHQIRLHFAAIGHPLAGDCLYGREGDGFPRTLLHAARLRFPHPTNATCVTVYAPIPEDFRHALAALALREPCEKDAVSEKALLAALVQNEG